MSKAAEKPASKPNSKPASKPNSKPAGAASSSGRLPVSRPAASQNLPVVARSPYAPEIGNTFLADSRYESAFVREGRRRVHHVGDRRHLLILFAALMFTVLAYFWSRQELDKELARSRAAEAASVTVTAVISGQRSIDNDRTVRDEYYVQYQFADLAGQPQQGETEIDAASYRRLVLGTPIMVKYGDNQPERSVLAHLPLYPVDAEFFQLMFVLPAATTALIALWAAWLSARYSLYARRGQVLKGEIITCDGRDIAGRFTLVLRYKFRTPDDAELSGVAKMPREDLRHNDPKDLPGPGTPVAILYVGKRRHIVL
jgi:hypothetical protein